MMTASRETTPLLGRRRAPSSLASPSDDLIDEDESSFQTSPSLNSRDTSKTDRRPWYARLAASCQAGLRGTARPSSSFSASPDPSRRRNPHFYMDDYNDFSWHCAFGTRETDGIWLNAGDKAGVWMSLMVWLLIVYSGVTVTLLCQQHRVHVIVGIVYTTICGLALASHAKTTFTDPGSIPHSAVPSYTAKALTERHILCGQCQGYKPHTAHHCRVCNRCIARMDHHCPWMNNCIGAANLKHFVLFLAYTWIGCALALLLFCHNYFACQNEDCMFSVVLVQLVRAMTAICVMALLFTSSMLMSVTYSVMTGSTTIDRYKKKLQNDATLSDEEPMALVDIFGIAPYWTWVLPIDPVFGDHDKVMGYCTPQRLLREHMIMQPGDPNDDGEGMTSSGAGSTSIGESDSRGYADV